MEETFELESGQNYVLVEKPKIKMVDVSELTPSLEGEGWSRTMKLGELHTSLVLGEGTTKRVELQSPRTEEEGTMRREELRTSIVQEGETIKRVKLQTLRIEEEQTPWLAEQKTTLGEAQHSPSGLQDQTMREKQSLEIWTEREQSTLRGESQTPRIEEKQIIYGPWGSSNHVGTSQIGWISFWVGILILLMPLIMVVCYTCRPGAHRLYRLHHNAIRSPSLLVRNYYIQWNATTDHITYLSSD